MSNTTIARQDTIEAVFGADYFMAEERGTRYFSERDFPLYDDSADQSRVSNEDWEAMGEEFYRFNDWN